jgi:hypothetical protein
VTNSLNPKIVLAPGEEAIFRPGDKVRLKDRTPIGHYRVPTYLRRKTGVMEAVIEPTGIDNEEEGYGADHRVASGQILPARESLS